MSAPTPPLTLIVAATMKNGIGKNGTLPWPMLKKEMAYFSRITKRVPQSVTSDTASQLSNAANTADVYVQPQNVVIMGRKTWDSIPPKFRPLPARTNVVISRQDTLAGVGEDVVVARDIQSGLEKLEEKVKAGKTRPLGRVFVIGGGAIYKAALELASAKFVLLTRVEGEWDCDTEFPVDLDESGEWKRRDGTELGEFVGEDMGNACIDEEIKGTAVRYEFRLYERA